MKRLLLILVLLQTVCFGAEYAKPHIVTTRPPAGAKVLLHYNGDLTNLVTGRDWYFEYGSLMSLQAGAAKYGSAGLEYQWNHSLVTQFKANASDVADVAAIGSGDFMYEAWVRVAEITEATTNSAHAIAQMYFYKTSSDYMTYTTSARMIIGDYSHYDLILSGYTIPTAGSFQYIASNLNVGDWHHIAFVRLSGTMYLYLDGNLVYNGVTTVSTYNLTGLTTIYDYSHTTPSGILAKTQTDDVMITTDVYTGAFTPPEELGDLAAPKISYGYERYNNYSNMITVPMETNGGSTIKSVGNYVGDGMFQYSSASEDSKYHNKYGLKMHENLSHDCMLVYPDVNSYIQSNNFTVGWWMRIDKIASVSSALNTGFNVYLRNANGLDQIRVGLIYLPTADTSKLDVKMGVRYRYGAVNNGFDTTATATLNVGDWNHFMVQRYLWAGNYYIVFIVNGTILGYAVNIQAASGSMAFAQYLWLGWFGFETPLEPYTKVAVSVDEFFYTPTIFNIPNTPKLTSTRHGTLTYKN